MSNAHTNQLLKESEIVTKRMQQSKREIELLRAEYERLLERGIQGPSASNITDTDKQKELRNKQEENRPLQPMPIPRRTQSVRKSTIENSPTKVRHYNIDDAREYIKKQKEKRLLQQKQIKQTDNAIQLKKQKLRELHQKSLEIVERNRQRSKSREKINADLKLPSPTTNASQSSPQNHSNQVKPALNNITYRASNTTPCSVFSAKSDDAKIKAATLIQAYFRGHLQRRIYQKLLQQPKMTIKNVTSELNQKAAKIVATVIEKPSIKELPDWLQPEPNYQPYNFITSVKRKLSLALSTPIRTSDVAIQSSFAIDEKTPQRSCREVRQLIEQNLSSKKSKSSQQINKYSASALDLDVHKLNELKLKKKNDHSDSDTSKNIPDISLESQFNTYKSTTSVHSASDRDEASSQSVIFIKKPTDVLNNKENRLELSKKNSVDDFQLIVDSDRLKDIKLLRHRSDKVIADNSMAESTINTLSNNSKLEFKSHSILIATNGSKRDSIITGNISKYTKIHNSKAVAEEQEQGGEETKQVPQNSFQQYMNDFNDSQKIMHTPFKPRHHFKRPNIDAEKHLRKVFSKVSQLDQQLKNADIKETYGDKLTAPVVNLVLKKQADDKIISGKTSVENVPGTGASQIHVKFEAELHLLNDFNDSLRQIMTIEKSMMDLQSKYNLTQAKSETRDAQTSVSSRSMSTIEKSINFSRGSDYNQQDSVFITDNSAFNISELSVNETTQSNLAAHDALIDIRQTDKLNNVGVSVGMFDQLIRDEDARIDNLKTVLKIREKALLDRTKSELTWLEIQKKHLLETGKLHEASLLKKKQRGIILRLQEEKNEMQRLKEMQKGASKERKSMLKQARSLVTQQLTSPDVVMKFKRTERAERRDSGPVKVYNYHSESSVSRKSSRSESIVCSDCDSASNKSAATANRTEMTKRSLQMREAALRRRRKETEALLKWHQKLLEEERKIAELEMAASNIINQVPSAPWNDMTVANFQKAKADSPPHSNDAASVYSMEFDDKESMQDIQLEHGIKQSESTLQQIMHNINNITDEISELYKLSSVPKKDVNAASDASIVTQLSARFPVLNVVIDNELTESSSISEKNTTEKNLVEEQVASDASPEVNDNTVSQHIKSEEVIDVAETLVEWDAQLPKTSVETNNSNSETIVSNLESLPSDDSTPNNSDDKIESSKVDELLQQETIESQIPNNNGEDEESQVLESDVDTEIDKGSSSEADAHESLPPIIDIKLEEKQKQQVDEVNESLLSVDASADAESLSIKESLASESNDLHEKLIDVKKRVSEILADANLNTSIEEKSPRLPDIYVTTYDVITISPENSPELGSPVDTTKAPNKPKDIYGIGDEAQELLRKQLAIEQEIKQIERQQKEQIPYIFVREIPNKPPPPYTPPIQPPVLPTSIIPTSVNQIDDITQHLADILYGGYVDKTLEYVTFPDFKTATNSVDDDVCAEFMFDICKELAIEHYKHFEEVATLSWMKQDKQRHFKRPYTQADLEVMIKRKLKQLFGFEKVLVKESMIIKWSRKRRDHVDELLIVESQAEEADWTNYGQDEMIVKNDVTNSILDILIGETVTLFQDILKEQLN